MSDESRRPVDADDDDPTMTSGDDLDQTGAVGGNERFAPPSASREREQRFGPPSDAPPVAASTSRAPDTDPRAALSSAGYPEQAESAQAESTAETRPVEQAPRAFESPSEPERSYGRERTVEPDRTSEPERSVEPDRMSEPERTAEPDRTPRPQRTAEPERGSANEHRTEVLPAYSDRAQEAPTGTQDERDYRSSGATQAPYSEAYPPSRSYEPSAYASGATYPQPTPAPQPTEAYPMAAPRQSSYDTPDAAPTYAPDPRSQDRARYDADPDGRDGVEEAGSDERVGDGKRRREVGAGFGGFLGMIALAAVAGGTFALPIIRYSGSNHPEFFFGNLRSYAALTAPAGSGSKSFAGGQLATIWWRYAALGSIGGAALLMLVIVTWPVLRRLAGGLLMLLGLGMATMFILAGRETNDPIKAVTQLKLRNVHIGLNHLGLGFWIGFGGSLALAIAGIAALARERR